MSRVIDLAADIGQVDSSIRFDLLDYDLSYLREIHPYSDGAGGRLRISNNVAATVKRTLAGIKLMPVEAATIDPIRHRIRPTWVYSDGTEYPLGVFMFTATSLQRSTAGSAMSVTLNDQGQILTYPMVDSYSVPVGGNLAAHAEVLLEQVGIVNRLVQPSDARAISPLAWLSGHGRNQSLDTLSSMLGYYSVYFDNSGVARLRAVDDGTITTVTAYSLENSRVLVDSPIDESSVATAPNVFIVVNSAPTQNEIRGVAYVDPAAPHSREQRGYEIPKTISLPGIESTDAATIAAQGYARASTAQYHRFKFSSSPDPRHDTFDVIEYDGVVYREAEWDLELTGAGGVMNHVVLASPILPQSDL